MLLFTASNDTKLHDGRELAVSTEETKNGHDDGTFDSANAR